MEIRKKGISFASLPMAFLLALTSVGTAYAQETNRLAFYSAAAGAGGLIWGAAGVGPQAVFGKVEYYETFEMGNLIFAGACLATYGHYVVVENLFEFDGYMLEEGTVKAAGHLIVKWAHEGSSYELNLVLASTEETSGAYIPQFEMLNHPYGLYSLFYIGMNMSQEELDIANPQYATLTYRGWMEVDGERERINGKALLLFAFNSLYNWQPKEWRQAALLLWTGEEYAMIVFAGLESMWGPYMVPAAKVVKAEVKVCQ